VVENSRQIVRLYWSSLGTQVIAITIDLEEDDLISPFSQSFVYPEDRGLYPGIGVENASGERYHSHQVVFFHQELAELFIGIATLEDDAFGDNDTGSAIIGEVFQHIVHKEDFAAFGLDAEFLMGTDATLGSHKGRIGKDHIGIFIPAVSAGEGVIFMDLRSGKAMQVHVYQ